MDSKKLRVVQIGAGGFGGYRRKSLRETGLFELVATYDLNATAMATAQQEDGAKPTASYAELLAQPGIEAVIIATGGKFHAEQALEAMARGLHVLVEKPLCATPAEVRALLAAQKKAGVVGATGHNDHHHEAHSRQIKDMLDRGDLGTVAAFEATTAHSGGQLIKPGDWRGDPAKNPGGMLFQCGVHKLHELMYYFGPVARVAATMRYDVHTTQTADVACCLLQFTSGLVGTLNAYHVTPYLHTLRILGTKTSLYRDDRFGSVGTLLETQTTKLDGAFEPRVPLTPTGTTDPCGNLRSFYAAVRTGSPCYPSLLDGARAVEVVFACEEAAKTGAWVDVAKLE